MTTTWRAQLLHALRAREETFADVVGNTMNDEDMDKEFDNGYGGTEGCCFTVWTTNHVYFPAQHDGSEWVGSVPRNPNGEVTPHVGGG
jgi:hypothetical protein